MKKYCQSLLVLLCVLVLTVSLCGCELLEKLSSRAPVPPPQQNTEPVQVENGYLYELPGDTTFHARPGSEEPVTATAKAGDSVVFRMVAEYEGTNWACTADGWFPVENIPADALYFWKMDRNRIVTETALAYAEPSVHSAVIGQVQIGTVENITTAVVHDGYNWSLFEAGWIREEYLAEIYDGTLMGIICVEEASLYAQPDTTSQVVGTPAYGSDIGVHIELTVDGTQWVFAKEGWIPKENVFVYTGSDTEPGEGACTARVPAGTGVNTYMRPSTESEVLETLYPCVIEILAQFTYDGEAWGITEMGWILMETVEIL